MLITFHLAMGLVLLFIAIVYILKKSKSLSSQKRIVGRIIRDMGLVLIIVFTVGFFSTGERYPFMYALRHPDPAYYGMLVLIFESIVIMILGENTNNRGGVID
jgi:uncharacterized membrane protein